jgi:hypothetical protein
MSKGVEQDEHDHEGIRNKQGDFHLTPAAAK